jgi:hypothetical protein
VVAVVVRAIQTVSVFLQERVELVEVEQVQHSQAQLQTRALLELLTLVAVVAVAVDAMLTAQKTNLVAVVMEHLD